jgi:hypothetical protein
MICARKPFHSAQPIVEKHRLRRRNVLGVWLVAGCVTGISQAFAACSKLPFSVTKPIIENFLVGPKYLLEQVSNTDELSYSVTNLLIANSRLTLPKVLELVRIATPEQKKAIGTGMAGAVTACFTPEPQSGAAIRDAVRNLRDNELSKAFNNGIAFTELDPDGFNAAPSVSIGGSTLSTGASPLLSAPSVGGGTLDMKPAEKSDDTATKTQGRLGLRNGRLWDPFAPPTIHDPKDKLTYTR